jgi:cation transport ATPase
LPDSNHETISQFALESHLPIEEEELDLVVFDFTVGGMSCVACSSTIERHMKSEFTGKKMTECAIALLTHKMSVTFKQSAFNEKMVSPQIICDEVEMIGFTCSLLSITEINAEAFKRRKTAAVTNFEVEASES